MVYKIEVTIRLIKLADIRGTENKIKFTRIMLKTAPS